MVLAILGATRGAQAKPLGGSETLAKTGFSAIPEVQRGKFAIFQDDVQKTENVLLAQARADSRLQGYRKGVQFEVRKWCIFHVDLNRIKFSLAPNPLKIRV